MISSLLSIIILSLLPALIYSLVIYFIMPYKSINLRTSFLYLLIGFASVLILKLMWIFVPATNLAEQMVNPLMNPIMYLHYLFFVDVAFFEEVSKLLVFLIIEAIRRHYFNVKDTPIGTMFYMGMVSLGFSVIENIQYGMNLGETVLYLRAFTAVIGHFLFGLFMGYWISKGRIGYRLYDRSLFDIIINKKKTFRMVFYTIVGLLSATILHGIYDLHLTLNNAAGITGIYMLLVFSIFGVFWAFKDLRKLYNAKQRQLKK